MPLDPTQQAEVNKLNELLPHATVIDGLQEGQEKITTTLDKLIEDVENESESNKREFAKGAEKFKEISFELKGLTSEVNEIKTQIGDGFKQQREDLALHLKETQDNEITRLTKKLDRNSSIKDGILSALISGILLAVALYFLIPAK